jgi:hypothetical protein
MEETVRATGVEQSGALPRVMRELIRTPVFRELLKLNLQESPPGTAAELARTVLWEDVDVTLSLLGSSPQAVNFLSEFLVETGRQFQNFPAEVLQIFIRQMGEKVDVESLQALPGAVSPVIDTLLWSDPAAVQGLHNLLAAVANASLWGASGMLSRLEEAPPTSGKRTSLDAEAVAELINSGARSLSKAAASRPGFLGEVASHIDREAVRGAADGALSALLRAGIPVLAMVSWTLKAAGKMIKAKLKG